MKEPEFQAITNPPHSLELDAPPSSAPAFSSKNRNNYSNSLHVLSTYCVPDSVLSINLLTCPQNPVTGRGTSILPISQVRELRPREVKLLAQR